MSLAFSEQLCLEGIKGLFLVMGVVLGGVYANRVLERFKSEQAISADLRKRQYETLAELLRALATVETTFNDWHSHVKHGREEEAAAAREALEKAHGAAEAAVDRAGYLLGDEIGNQAITLLDFFTDSETHPPLKLLDEAHYVRLTELRGPLIALLPPLPAVR
jgi:hypothetical protein